MTVSWDDYSQLNGKIKNVPKHQPSISTIWSFLSLTCWSRHWPTLPGKEIDMVMTKNNYCNALVKIWRSVILPFPSSCLITYQFPLVKKPCLMIKSRWIMAHFWIELIESLSTNFWWLNPDLWHMTTESLCVWPIGIPWHPHVGTRDFLTGTMIPDPSKKNGKIPCI